MFERLLDWLFGKQEKEEDITPKDILPANFRGGHDYLEEEIVEIMTSTLTNEQLAVRWGRTPAAIRVKRNKLNRDKDAKRR